MSVCWLAREEHYAPALEQGKPGSQQDLSRGPTVQVED